MRVPLLCVLFALRIFPAEPDAESLIRSGHWKRAREAAEANYRAHPNDARAAYLLARVRHAFKDFDDEFKYAEAAVRLDPKASAHHRELGQACMYRVEHSSMLKALGLMRKAHSEFDAAVAIDPKDPDNLFEKIDFLLQAPVLAGGDRTRALDVANELVKIDPARGYLALARIAWKQKEFGRLEGLYRKAAQSNPQSYEAQMALANLYLGNPVVPEDLDASSRANFHLAEEHARAALDLNPDRIDAYRALVMALVSGRRWDETAKVLARVEAAIPDDLSPYVVAARAMLREGVELTRAESYLKKYSTQTQEPEVGAPLLAGAHWSLALVYQKGGRTADARTELETVLRLKPDFEAARRELERLR